MKNQQSIDRTTARAEVLDRIYVLHEETVADLKFACGPGCATCCTRSVTMTTLEGRVILHHLAEGGRSLPPFPVDHHPLRPACTTNQLAKYYLAGKEPPHEQESPWVFEPCPFLAAGLCSIYPVRPFACRSFGSLVRCDQGGCAEVPDWLIDLNIATSQIIEHYDAGGSWGNLVDILKFLSTPDRLSSDLLLKNQALAGFLLADSENETAHHFLHAVQSIVPMSME
ncbi:MAG: YkgJ family cysteine cluster protein [Proteobacteria bacterium]|nr:YkgJ family cysteine cluster protein [Pseudomonadota bacterium]MBU1686945.1 YkgJ family cysteine cluster protein [Pseudomonadota bacterium]